MFSEDDLDPRRYIAVLWRSWPHVLITALVFGAAAFIWSWLSKPVYEARAVLTVVASKIGEQPATASMPAFKLLLQNRDSAARVLADIGVNKPPYNISAESFITNNLTAEDIVGTNMLQVRVRLADPVLAAKAANALAAGAIDLNLEMNEAERASARTFIGPQLEAARRQLDTIEAQLRKRSGDAPIASSRADADALLNERVGLVRLRAEIESEKARVTQAEKELAAQTPTLPADRVGQTDALLIRDLDRAPQRPAQPPLQPSRTADVQPSSRDDGAAEQKDSTRAGFLSSQRKADERAGTGAGFMRTERKTDSARSDDGSRPTTKHADASQPSSAPARPGSQAVEATERPSLSALDISGDARMNPVYLALEYQAATGRTRLAGLEREWQTLVDRYKLTNPTLDKVSQLSTRELELERLRTEYELARDAYGKFYEEYEAARLRIASHTSQLQMFDPALPPERPIAPHPARALALGLLVGALIGAIAVLLAHYVAPVRTMAADPRL